MFCQSVTCRMNFVFYFPFLSVNNVNKDINFCSATMSAAISALLDFYEEKIFKRQPAFIAEMVYTGSTRPQNRRSVS